MEGCIFCKIANNEIPVKMVYQDDKVVAFHDIAPKAPVHVLIIPRVHIASLNDIAGDGNEIAGHIIGLLPEIAALVEVEHSGYRVVINCGQDGGQSVAHLHYHLLGGRALTWPPG